MEILYQGLINFHINNSLHLLRGSTNNPGHLIADKDIALYFRHHLEQPKIFNKIVRVLKEYDQDSVANYELHNLIFETWMSTWHWQSNFQVSLSHEKHSKKNID